MEERGWRIGDWAPKGSLGAGQMGGEWSVFVRGVRRMAYGVQKDLVGGTNSRTRIEGEIFPQTIVICDSCRALTRLKGPTSPLDRALIATLLLLGGVFRCESCTSCYETANAGF